MPEPKFSVPARPNGPQSSCIFKIVARDAWDAACRAGVYNGSADDLRDGFIHLSAPHQVNGTLHKYFSAQRNLFLIAYETNSLGPELKWEVSRGGDLFPHLYAPLPTALALWHRPLDLGPQNHPICDEAWLKC